ncbi:MAG: hypothetical protein K2N73_04450 [Lachnospiraceae bacterium]|nr:hypothetical protein [Lachnospiraceae bacterium]
MNEANTIQALKKQIKDLKDVISSLSEGKSVILNHVALDSLVLGNNCTVEMNHCSTGIVLSGNADNFDVNDIECKLEDLHCQIDDISCMLEDLRCQFDDLDFQMNDIDSSGREV